MKDDARTALAHALVHLANDGYRTGQGWQQAHVIAQAHEGEALFDRLHALCHRIEGDDGNARYWYCRAGIGAFDGPFEAEAQAIREAAGSN